MSFKLISTVSVFTSAGPRAARPMENGAPCTASLVSYLIWNSIQKNCTCVPCIIHSCMDYTNSLSRIWWPYDGVTEMTL